MLPERTVRTIHVYKGVASVAVLLETLMDETPHIFWINVCHKKKSIYRYYVYLHRSTHR